LLERADFVFSQSDLARAASSFYQSARWRPPPHRRRGCSVSGWAATTHRAWSPCK